MYRSTFFLLATFLAAAPTIRADEPKKMPANPDLDPFNNNSPAAPAEKKTVATPEKPAKKPTEEEIKALIDKLVSPNPEPEIINDYYKLPPGFDREKQKLVCKAMFDLEALGPQAFPFLVDRWDDERFCLTTSYGPTGYCHNENVGKVCRMIIFDQIQPYGNWQGVRDDGVHIVPRPAYPSHFLSSKEEAKKWCEEHKEKMLAKIQLEVLDWVIADENDDTENYSAKERNHLQELRGKLKGKMEPLRGHYYPIDIEE
jgi:hypothetical protein